MHCDVISMIFAYYSKLNFSRCQAMDFCKISYQPILRYLYTEVKNRRGEISLQKILMDSISFCSYATYSRANKNVSKLIQSLDLTSTTTWPIRNLIGQSGGCNASDWLKTDQRDGSGIHTGI